ncbi:L-fuconate dehydratase [Micromonospora matsumotoense]|uniref:L-fuconate dehydratase n=1 Tax=Micromonospora matsumotoense TaxID=121616 RepID=A0A1C5APQ4_9ACTN|nr:enolase C-terminal domain-like protein [Micromonospora matsumotoense]SCF47192.1 L-fuconate dehydratase [Micromonospora matsumotoense]
MTERITSVDTIDVRFPTSVHRDGSDAMNPFPDYSAAYVVLRTSAGAEGHGLIFTVGRGTEIQVAAVRSLAAMVIDQPVDALVADPGALARRLVGDSQIRWLGPAKGVVHMAAGGLVNAVWDLAARRAGKPLWKLLADLTPEQLVAQVDFRYLRDALTEDEALALLRRANDGRAAREQQLRAEGYPAYTTTPGWLGYDDEKLARLCAEAVRDGYQLIKLKVGGDLADDVRRMGIARQAVGPQIRLAVDANQIWGVPEAIRWMRELAAFDPYWIEEPTSPDDVLGHAAVRKALSPIRVATGEHVHNAVVFKQLLQADAVDVVQIDACRVAGVNENLAILLLAAHFGVPVCPHAGGVGLCELVQHLAMFDFVAVSGSTDDRAIEYVDHLHEHFVDPVRVTGGRYLAPTTPGMSAEILPTSLAAFRFPDGPQWADTGAPAEAPTQ